MAVSWKGVFPAITTKFTSQNQLDLGLFKKNLSAQLDAGINGIVLGGSLGEASVLTNVEKEILVKETLQFVEGKVPVIINIAEGSTDVAIELAQEASLWGAQGLMLLPPMRYKADDRETVQYFKDVAESTSLPIMIYNNPVDYKIDVTIDMFAELASVSNIQAIKESTRDVTNVTRLRNAFGDRFSILCGVDTLALEELVLGADGWV
ncbi:MAG: dihydrodipicolinate synthase family protein, partial [Bacteroidota bacterium]